MRAGIVPAILGRMATLPDGDLRTEEIPIYSVCSVLIFQM